MEVQNITVKVKLAGVVVQAVAVLTDREGRPKEGAAAALCAERQSVLRDRADAGVLVGAENARGGS